MQAIRTRKCNGNSIRVQAKCEGKTIYVGWDDALDHEGNHKAAAAELCKRLDWQPPIACGCFNGDFYHTLPENWKLKRNIYTVEPGRHIHRNGEPFVYVQRANNTVAPAEADTFTREIVVALTR